MNERIARVGANLAGPRVQRARARWGRPIAVALSIVITALGVAFFIAAGNQVGWTRVWFDDLKIYRDATERLFAGGGWYLQRQLDGPYHIQFGDVLYPPVTAWFFMPWLLLPAWTFSALPVGILAWFVRATRPAAWTWPVMAFCLAFPVTLVYIAYANPTIWIAAFVALGLRYAWPGVLILLKPSLAPFALIGIRSRSWWIGLIVLGLASLPFLAMTLDYPRILLDSRGGDLLYSGTSIPILVLPVVAWLGRTVNSPARDWLRGLVPSATGRRGFSAKDVTHSSRDPHEGSKRAARPRSAPDPRTQVQGCWTWRCPSCRDDRREGFGIEQQESANVPTTPPVLAATRVEARRRLWRFGLIVATVVILLFAAVAAAIVLPPAFARPGVTLGMDYGIYMDRTRDWLAGNGFYTPQQLAGPYQIDQGVPPALYPPVLLYLTVPFSVLPAVLWWAIPLGIIAAALWHLRPPLETWPLLAVLLCYPRTWVMLIYGNPSMWAFAALVAGLAWTWPAPLVAIKVTLGPFALVGIRRRSWWITAGVALALCVPFAAMWPEYVTAISNARNGYGLEYLVGEWPIAVALVVVAWVRATRGAVPLSTVS